MPVNRRTFLQCLAATAVLPPAGRPYAQGATALPFFLIVDGITAGVSPAAVELLLTALSEARLAAGFLLRPAPSGTPLPTATKGTLALLRQYLLNSPDLGEPIAWAPGLAEARPFFQLREAQRARDIVTRLLRPGPETGAGNLRPVTVATEGHGTTVDLSPVRAMGFRNLVLLSDADATTISDRCGRAMPCLRGNLIWRPGAALAAPLTRAAASNPVQLVLRFDRLDTLGPDAMQSEIRRIISAVSDRISAGELFAALPRDNVLWFAADTARIIGLVVEPPDDPVARPDFAAFTAALADADVPYSLAEPGPALDVTDCLRLLPAGSRPTGPAGACAFAASPPSGLGTALADAGLAAVLSPKGPPAPELDEDGVLHLAAPPLAAEPAPGTQKDLSAGLRDMLLSVSPDAYADSYSRSQLVQTLAQLKGAGPAKIRNVPGFLTEVFPPDPVYDLMLATRHDSASAPPAPVIDAGTQKDVLMQDAKIAWAYFTRMEEPGTGLCATAVFDGPLSKSVQHLLTMWDLANLIQATMAAHELGLIGSAEYGRRAHAILRNLPMGRIAGLVLPNSEIVSNRHAASAWDYNPFDTGHLLSALHEMNRYPLSRHMAAPYVAKWQLAKTIVDGRFQWVSHGRLRPAPISQYSHYTARAFGLWNIAADSPYALPRTMPATDTRMQLLYTVADIGAIGTEPMLVEGVEMGLSPPSAYLADVLFFAQKRAYEASGDLYCVTESPIDRPPWFVYEGFLVDRPSDPWAIVPISTDPEYDSKAFRDSIRLISPKAAFLWAAMHPGPYSDQLLAYVRSRARLEKGGYASGVYAQTGEPTKFYSDINTNGVILQAIAYIVRGRRPRPH